MISNPPFNPVHFADAGRRASLICPPLYVLPHTNSPVRQNPSRKSQSPDVLGLANELFGIDGSRRFHWIPQTHPQKKVPPVGLAFKALCILQVTPKKSRVVRPRVPAIENTQAGDFDAHTALHVGDNPVEKRHGLLSLCTLALGVTIARVATISFRSPLSVLLSPSTG
jgi:hypothetical protein